MFFNYEQKFKKLNFHRILDFWVILTLFSNVEAVGTKNFGKTLTNFLINMTFNYTLKLSIGLPHQVVKMVAPYCLLQMFV